MAAAEARNDGDNAFYEDIEAPKFVDLSATDRPREDGASWFCVRIGCDQMHEEVDPDALYRNFVLRVLAARSPHVRPRRALNDQLHSRIPKCPNSAPEKLAKDRPTRLNQITLIPEKMAALKFKSQEKSNVRTPIGKTKVLQSQIEKSLTAPTKKLSNNQEQFRSANPRRNQIHYDPSKCRVVKSLFMETQKKDIGLRGFLGKSSRCAENETDHHSFKGKNSTHLPQKGVMSSVDVKKGKIKAVCNEENEKTSSIFVESSSKDTGRNSSLEVAFQEHSGNLEKGLHPSQSREDMKVNDDKDENKENFVDHGGNRCIGFVSIVAEKTGNYIKSFSDLPQKERLVIGVKNQGKTSKATTCPKPFRLRTDERGILREANIEKWIQGSFRKENETVVAEQGDQIQLNKKVEVKLPKQVSKMRIERATRSEKEANSQRGKDLEIKKTIKGTRSCTSTKFIWR